MNLLTAVVEKRLGLPLSGSDVYVNMAGGMRLNEPAMDLAIISALISSYKDKAVSAKTIIFGEVGLTGEIRAVSMAEQRVAEASKLGFEICIMPKVNVKSVKNIEGMCVIGVETIKDILNYF